MTTPPVAKSGPLADTLKVRSQLMMLGWASLAQWAKAFGHKPITAGVAIRTWAHRTDRTPHGGLSRAVMRDLSATLEKSIGPSDLKQTA